MQLASLMRREKNRDFFWQVVRGICILAVVMIHCPSAESFAIDSPQHVAWLLLRQVIDFPVAIFFFLSGYFVNQGNIMSAPGSYIKKRVWFLVVPYLIWTIIYSGISIIRQTFSGGGDISWSSYILNFLTGGAAAPFYYIVCLLQITLLTPVIIKLMQKRFTRNIIWLITPVYLIGLYLCEIFAPGLDVVLSNRGLFFPAWLLFFCLGLYAKDGGLNSLSEKFGKFRFIFIGLVLECIEAAVIEFCGLNSSFAVSQLRFTSYLYVALICLWLLRIYSRKNLTISQTTAQRQSLLLRGFRYIGDRSYGIFYIHCLILMVINAGISLFAIDDLWPLNFLIAFILTVVISIVVIDVVSFIANKIRFEKGLKWIGFS